jgi:hypothetical protein
MQTSQNVFWLIREIILPVLLLFCLVMVLLWFIYWTTLGGFWKALKQPRGYPLPLDRLYLVLLFIFILVMFLLGSWPM